MAVSKNRLPALLALPIVGTAPVAAHDFWVQPNLYWIAPAARTPLTLEVGHGPDRQRSAVPVSRITRFEAIGARGTRIDLRPLLQLGGPTNDGAVVLDEPGTYVLALQTDARAYSLLPAIRFNDYLRVEGLTPALTFRERTHRTNADGSETYSRQAKTLVKVGTQFDAPTPATRALGLTLEIVPEIDPYANPAAKQLPVHVLYRGQPLAGALVKLTNLEHDTKPMEMHVTDRAGRAIFNAPHSGDWLINVIWTEIAPPSSDADFETTFSSLAFGFSSSTVPKEIKGSKDDLPIRSRHLFMSIPVSEVTSITRERLSAVSPTTILRLVRRSHGRSPACKYCRCLLRSVGLVLLA